MRVFSQQQRKREVINPALVVTEACTLKNHVDSFIVDRNWRIEKLSCRKKRGSLVRLTGNFHTSVSLNQTRQQDNKLRKTGDKKMMKAPLREGRRAVNLELQRLQKVYEEARADDKPQG
ncbi:hypothetical protein GGI35DRAFT_472919 [Trichoderma velutinum]